MKMVSRLILLGIIILNIALFIPSQKCKETDNNTLYVGGFGEGNYTKIQYAIENSSINDTVYVYKGIYDEVITINKPLNLIGSDKNDTIIDGNGKNFEIITILKTQNVNISGFTIENSTKEGIKIFESNDIKIYRNKIKNSSTGINITRSFQNHIVLNLITENKNGLVLTCGVESGPNTWAEPVCFRNNITRNNITNNNGSGIIIAGSSKNNVINNFLIENLENGIRIKKQKVATFTDFYFMNSSENIIYHNNFIENFENANDSEINQWSFNQEGNYWSDYNGVDKNNDAIGDTIYQISGGKNIDNYPLMAIYRDRLIMEEFYVHEQSLYKMLIIAIAAAIIFSIPIAYIWYRKRKKLQQ